MKKIVFLLLFVFMVIPNIVLADCGIIPMKMSASVINKDGAKLYILDNNNYVFSNKVLNYGEEFTIGYEYDGYASIDIANKVYFIKKEDYKAKAKMKNTESTEGYTMYTYRETHLRNTPSFYSYEIVATIPTNVEVYIEADDYQEWGYVTYNGKSGWIYIGSCSLNENEAITIANKYDTPLEAYLFVKENKMVEGYEILGNSNTKKSTNLKNGEKVEILYDYTMAHGCYHYIRTNSINGLWLYESDGIGLYTENKQPDAVLFTENLATEPQFFEVLDFTTLKPVNLPIETYKLYNYKYAFYHDSAVVIEIEDKFYFINAFEDYIHLFHKEPVWLNLLKNESILYSSTNRKTIPKGEYEAFVASDVDTEASVSRYYIPNYGIVIVNKNESLVLKTETDPKENQNEQKENQSISPLTYVSYYIIGASILSIFAIILIVVLNKKKKDKNHESK